jgi:hypothetical protein
MIPCRAKPAASWLLAILSLTMAHATEPAASPEQALNEHRAACVAALTAQAEPLAKRLKAGDDSAQSELLRLTESGFALIGAAYRDGLRKPEADQLLDAAKKAQKALPAAELGKLQVACQAEGVKVLADSNMLERFLVTSAASRRVNRIAESGKQSREGHN